MSGHTPGPWTLVVVHPDEPSPNRMAPWGRVERPNAGSIEAKLADARLIAAAPSMYDYIRARADAGDAEAKALLGGIHADS